MGGDTIEFWRYPRVPGKTTSDTLQRAPRKGDLGILTIVWNTYYRR